jgi:hypothetical protein
VCSTKPLSTGFRLKMLRCCDVGLLPRSTSVRKLQHHTEATTSDHGLHMLPSARTIITMYSRLLNPSKPPQFCFFEGNELISDLPLIKGHLKDLGQNCQCPECHRIAIMPASSKRLICRKDSFFGLISFIIVDMLVLSLIVSPAPLLVRASLHREGGIEGKVSRHLRTRGNTQDVTYSDILAWPGTWSVMKWRLMMKTVIRF